MLTTKPTILVADDDSIIRHIFDRSLAPHYDVLMCKDGQEALDRARAYPADIVLAVLDWDMPKLVGPDVGGILWLELHIPFTIVSRGRTQEEIDYAYSQGAIDFIHKPVDNLGAKIQRLMAQPIFASIGRERARRFPRSTRQPIDLAQVD